MRSLSSVFCFVFCMFFSYSIFAEDSEILNEKKAWNLLRDLKDYKAGRLKMLNDNSIIDIPTNDADYVTLRTTATQTAFGVAFPLPDSSKISMIIIEMDFKWPSSKGGIQITFGQNKSMFSGRGVALSYLTLPGIIRLGKLSGAGEEAATDTLSPMGADSHSLKLIYKDGILFATLDKKILTCSSAVSPSVISLAGLAFEDIQITRLKAQIAMKDSK